MVMAGRCRREAGCEWLAAAGELHVLVLDGEVQRIYQAKSSGDTDTRACTRERRNRPEGTSIGSRKWSRKSSSNRPALVGRLFSSQLAARQHSRRAGAGARSMQSRDRAQFHGASCPRLRRSAGKRRGEGRAGIGGEQGIEGASAAAGQQRSQSSGRRQASVDTGRCPPPLGPVQARHRPSHPPKPAVGDQARLHPGLTLHLAFAPPAPSTRSPLPSFCRQSACVTNASCRCSRSTRKTRPTPCPPARYNHDIHRPAGRRLFQRSPHPLQSSAAPPCSRPRDQTSQPSRLSQPGRASQAIGLQHARPGAWIPTEGPRQWVEHDVAIASWPGAPLVAACNGLETAFWAS